MMCVNRCSNIHRFGKKKKNIDTKISVTSRINYKAHNKLIQKFHMEFLCLFYKLGLKIKGATTPHPPP